MSKVICVHHNTCSHKEDCGGAKPHVHDDGECGKCPMDKTSSCVSYIGPSTKAVLIMAEAGGFYDETGEVRCLSCGRLNEMCTCHETNIVTDPDRFKEFQSADEPA